MQADSRRIHELIIVGAGLAGLSVAAHLPHDKDRSVVILEARDRIGGRAHTVKVGDIALDLGCAWVHQIHGNALFQVAKQLQLDLREDHLDFQHDDAAAAYHEAEQALVGGLAAESQAGSPPFEADAASWLRQQGQQELKGKRLRLYDRSLGMLAAYAAIPLEQVSMRFWGSDRTAIGPDLFNLSGYERIIEHLVDQARSASGDFEIALNSPVESLNYEEDKRHISIDLKDEGVLRAKHVIVTVPLGCLQNGDIHFKPPLAPRKEQAIMNIAFGKIGKLMLVYEQRWWAQEFGGILFFESEEPFPTIDALETYVFDSEQAHVVNIIIPPAHVDAFEALDDATLSRWGHAALCKGMMRLPKAQSAPPTRLIATKWASDPYSRGSYCCIRRALPGELEAGNAPSPLDFLELSKSCWDGRLGFAGEATHEDLWSFAHGAYASGQREAERLKHDWAAESSEVLAGADRHGQGGGADVYFRKRDKAMHF